MNRITMIGNAHLDPVWFWQWQEGYQEVKATFQSALDRMNESDDFVFTCACAAYYKWVEENAPEMFAQIKKRVAEGRWVIVGGMWIQPDMNTPSGESFVRQLLYSQNYFYRKFGKIATVGYNVDSFGHNAALPQIYTLAGIRHYVWMRPDIRENQNIPEGTMIWEGIDGTAIEASRIFSEYTCYHDIPQKLETMYSFSRRIDQPTMCFYGVGNHGGGPTIENIRLIHQYQAENEHGGDVVFGSPNSFFEALDKEKQTLPIWRGELQHHASGCYSTHSASKLLHRRAENYLLRMEKLGALSRHLVGHEIHESAAHRAWENLMFNEFHDIMGGCSVREVLDDSLVQLGEAVSIAQREENAALQKISWSVDTSKGNPIVRSKEEEEYGRLWGIRGQGTPVVVFNPHGFEAEGTVRIGSPIHSVRDDNGEIVPVQAVRSSRTNLNDIEDAIFRAKVPALGYRLYWVFQEETGNVPSALTATETLLENQFIRAEFDKHTGALIHLTDKRSGFDALNGATSARLADIEHCDTWAHNIFKFDKEAGSFSGAETAVLESGPVRAVLEVKTRFATSKLRIRYILYAGADQLEAEVYLDMREHYRMLKLCFPTDATHDVAEIAYGAIERDGNGNEEHCQRWVVAQGKDGGLAIVNNGKYSYSMQNGELRVTVSNTSVFADHYGQSIRDGYVEWMDQGEQRFQLLLVPFCGSWRDVGLHARADVLNQPLPRIVETYHCGTLGGSFSGIGIDNAAIELGAVKESEDGKGLVIRLVEATGCRQTAHIDVTLLQKKLDLEFAPFQIKTLLIPYNDALPKEISLTEIGD